MKKITEHNQFVRSFMAIQRDLSAINFSINNCWRELEPIISTMDSSQGIAANSPRHISRGAELFSENTRLIKELQLFSCDQEGVYDSTQIKLSDFTLFVSSLIEFFHNNTHVLLLLNNPLVESFLNDTSLIFPEGNYHQLYSPAEGFNEPEPEGLASELCGQDKFFRVMINFEKFLLGIAEFENNLYIASLNLKTWQGKMTSFLKTIQTHEGKKSFANLAGKVREISTDWNNFNFLRMMKTCTNISNDIGFKDPVSASYNLYRHDDRMRISVALLSLVKISGEARRAAGDLERLIVIK